MAVRPRGPRLLRCGGPSMWCGRGAGSSNCPDRDILTSRVSPDGTMTRSGNRPDPNKSPRTGGRLDSRTLPFTPTRDARIGRMIAGHQETPKQYAPTIAQDGPRCSRECNAPTLPTTTPRHITTTTIAMPRIETTVRQLFKFHELTAEAKERACDNARVRGHGDDVFGDEWQETLKEAGKALHFSALDWEVSPHGYTYCSVRADGENIENLRGIRAWKYLRNNYGEVIDNPDGCPFTGMSSDESLLDPLRAFLKAPDLTVTLQDLFTDCADSWARAWAAEMEWRQEDAQVGEDLEANEHEFLEDGTFA